MSLVTDVKLKGHAPRIIPPRTSAITFGWRIFHRTRASKLAVDTMIPIESNKWAARMSAQLAMGGERAGGMYVPT